MREVTILGDPEGELLLTLAIGSCNKENRAQILWDDILAENPDVWIWLGDNVYGDTNDTLKMKAKYQKQKSNPLYQELLSVADIYGIWDDHDYGVNDGGQEFKAKDAMRDLMFEFLDVPRENEAWTRKGGYQSYDLEQNGLTVKLILLDSRYFRDKPIKSGDSYLPNLEGSILGVEQWQWLELELGNSSADVNLIGNGIQVLPAEHRFEKWNNFPNERQKLLDLIESNALKNVILLSGDRHLSELSQYQSDNDVEPIYDITSSGMTHSYTAYSEEPNQLRQGDVVASKSYGVIRIYKTDEGELDINLRFMGDGGNIFQSFDLF